MQPARTPCPHTKRLTTWQIRVTPLSGCTRSYVMTFVVVTILSAMDFWTVKNVSGRLLVGLRWWNDVDEAGQNHWRFESFEARGRPRPPFTEAVAAPPRHAMRVCVCPSLGRRSSDSSTRQTATSSGPCSSQRPSPGGYSRSPPSSPSRSCGACSPVRPPSPLVAARDAGAPLAAPLTTQTTESLPLQALPSCAMRSTSSATSSAKRMRARSCRRSAGASC